MQSREPEKILLPRESREGWNAEVEKAVMQNNEKKNGKAVEEDRISDKLLKHLGQKGKKVFVRFCSKVYNQGDWPEDFTQPQSQISTLWLRDAAQVNPCSP